MDEHVSFHEWLYSDPKRVARARVQAKGRIAERHLREVLIESWAAPTAKFASRHQVVYGCVVAFLVGVVALIVFVAG